MEKIINDILKVITCSENFDPNDFEDFGKEILNYVSNWVKENKVEKVRYYVNKEELIDFIENDFEDIIKSFTDYQIDIIDDFDKFNQLIDNSLVMGEGPGFDIQTRSEISYTDKFFYTGSDATFYVLIEKI